MSREQLKAFLEKVQGDTSLQDRLKAAKSQDDVVSIAKDAGFMITAEELKNAQAEVSEEELEGVAGGVDVDVTLREGGILPIRDASPVNISVDY